MRIPPPAHLPLVPATRASATGRAYRLNESGAPPYDGSPESVLAIVTWLGVERHARWRPGGGQTFCNVYATDVAYLLGVYLPRVWWLPAALAEFAAEKAPSVRYAATVGELSANALYRWLDRWSGHYGWRRTQSLDEAQDAANAGRCVVVCARHKVEASPGHISCVVPESARARAKRDGAGVVVLPVQSQAGGRNVELGVTPPAAWWISPSFPEWGVWIHDPRPRPSDAPDTEPQTPRSKSDPHFRAVREPQPTHPDGPANPLGWADRAERILAERGHDTED